MTSAQNGAGVPGDPEEFPPSISFVLPTVEHTLALGSAMGQRLRAGDLVILTGALGAGKTALTKGIGAGLGVVGTVMSPTFVIARVHAGDVPLVHVDAYRLTGAVELDDLDLDTDLGRSAVVVEWGDGVAEQLTDRRVIVALERLPDDTRIARLTPVGADWVERLRGLPEAVEPGAVEPGAVEPGAVEPGAVEPGAAER